MLGTGTVRPIGVSPGLEKNKGEDWWRGHQWPPTDLAKPWENAALGEFPRRAWGPYYHAVAMLGEFTRSQADGLTWDKIDLARFLPTGKEIVKGEIDDLVSLIEYRSGVLGEAMAQRDSMLDYWRGVLSFNQISHPWTFDLASIALRVAEFQEMHYKRVFNRPRPSHLSPALMPPVDPPGHASFPSGHATESYLLSLCLAEVMPEIAREPLQRLADRVARNREVLGVHYRSDSVAGKALAEQTFALLKVCPSLTGTRDAPGILDLARQEWRPARVARQSLAPAA